MSSVQCLRWFSQRRDNDAPLHNWLILTASLFAVGMTQDSFSQRIICSCLQWTEEHIIDWMIVKWPQTFPIANTQVSKTQCNKLKLKNLQWCSKCNIFRLIRNVVNGCDDVMTSTVFTNNNMSFLHKSMTKLVNPKIIWFILGQEQWFLTKLERTCFCCLLMTACCDSHFCFCFPCCMWQNQLQFKQEHATGHDLPTPFPSSTTLSHCKTMEKPKLSNKLAKTIPTTNETEREQRAFVLDVPTSGLNQSIQSSKASKTNSTPNGWECPCLATDSPALEKSFREICPGNSQSA